MHHATGKTAKLMCVDDITVSRKAPDLVSGPIILQPQMSLTYHYSPGLWFSVNMSAEKTKDSSGSDGPINSRCLLKDLAMWPKTW